MAWATIATAGAITFGSIWGTLTRLGLVALNTYDGQSIAPLVWAQAVGCLVYGYASHKRSKAAIEGWYAPAFPMITVGFAGSCTSFSTWALDVFQAFSNGGHHDRIGLYSVMDALAQTATTVGMGLAGIWAGRALADAYPLPAIPTMRIPPHNGTSSGSPVGRPLLDRICPALWPVCTFSTRHICARALSTRRACSMATIAS